MQTGYYEFVFCGLLRGENTNSETNIQLEANQVSFLTITLPPQMKQMYFSQFKIEYYQEQISISSQFQKTDTANVSAENIYLIIKKLASIDGND